jgi:transglutaminase-like putative cysteine protease
MQLLITHKTRYVYDTPVVYALQKARLRPSGSRLQDVESWDLTVEGGRIEAGYRDHYGNLVDLISATPGTQELVITAQGTVNTHDLAGVLGFDHGRAPLWHFQQSTPVTTLTPETAAPFLKVLADASTPLEGLHALSAAVLEKVSYDTEKTHAATTAEEAMTIGHGVCQDHSHIFIAIARQAGFPARYVSGYLRIDGQVDQTASHAWAEVHVPNLGWVAFDVSNMISPDDRYVRLAIGRDGQDASPVSGLRMGPGSEQLVVSLQVQQ